MTTPHPRSPVAAPDRPQAEDVLDAVVVGGRCAGSALSIQLARAGWRVAVVERSRLPSDVLSTHVLFPDGVAALDRLGALDRLRERHHLVPARYSWRVLGQAVCGTFTPVEGHDRALCVRRVTLDAALSELATEAGATVLQGHRVVGLLGSGADDDPVRGVVLDDGRELAARWVLGADGQRSSVAHHLDLARRQERRGELAMLLGYWRGLPPSDCISLDMHPTSALMTAPCEDGLHLITVAGPPELTRGTPDELAARYHRMLHGFPAVLNPRLLDAAELVGPVRAAPETLMRGYFREASGRGWALVGDAVHLKHPTTGQGIGDALAQADHVATALLGGGDLDGYGEWLAERSVEAFEFSFAAARPPGPGALTRYAGLAADPVASKEFLDTFTRRGTLADVFSRERSRRWRAAAAYEDGLRRLVDLVETLDGPDLARTVPACPLWSVRDLVAHLVGVAEDSVNGRFFAGALDAWDDPALAAEREAWTAGQVAARREQAPEQLVADLERHGQALVRALRRGEPAATDVPGWMIGAPVADLAVHLHDLREALGLAPGPAGLADDHAFASYRAWLGARLAARGLPPLRLATGEDPAASWLLGGDEEPAAQLVADGHELFRAVSGRRTVADVASWTWHGDPAPFLPVLSPYPPS